MSEDDRWLIWSYEHDAWWRPGGFGYTRELAKAGRYSGANAERIIQRANVVTLNEVAVQEGEAGRFKPSPSIACPFCRRRSFNLDDIAQRYCGACHRFHDTLRPLREAVAAGAGHDCGEWWRDGRCALCGRPRSEREHPEVDCECRNPRCGHKASEHVGADGACVVAGCRCGPGGWT